MKAALRPLVANLFSLKRYRALEKPIRQAHRADADSQRLAKVPGIGVLTALVLSASVTAPDAFKGGREFAAYLGLVPMQYTTGGKPRLGHISKMGNRDIRRLLVVGAIAILARRKRNARRARRLGAEAPRQEPFRLVAVALANKMARIAWAIMAKGVRYERAHAHAGLKRQDEDRNAIGRGEACDDAKRARGAKAGEPVALSAESSALR